MQHKTPRPLQAQTALTVGTALPWGETLVLLTLLALLFIGL